MYLFTVDTSRTLITKHTMPKSPGRSRKITSSLAEYLGRLSVYDLPCTVLIFVRTCARILTFPLYLSGLLVFPFGASIPMWRIMASIFLNPVEPQYMTDDPLSALDDYARV